VVAVNLPRFCSVPNVLEALSAGGVLGEQWDEVELIIPPKAFVLCSTMSFLCAWGLLQQREEDLEQQLMDEVADGLKDWVTIEEQGLVGAKL